MHTGGRVSSSSLPAVLETRTDYQAEHSMKAVKKLALAILLPYPVVSDLRRVWTCTRRQKETDMLWTIFVILLVLWLLGLVSSYTLGGFIHILLIIAVLVLVIQLLQGRRTPPL